MSQGVFYKKEGEGRAVYQWKGDGHKERLKES
jgi:hypothetical protein